MIIVVNGTAVQTDLFYISYDEVVAMAGMSGAPSVVYCSRRDGDMRRTGTMYPGCSPVLLSDVMTFDVCHTGGA